MSRTIPTFSSDQPTNPTFGDVTVDSITSNGFLRAGGELVKSAVLSSPAATIDSGDLTGDLDQYLWVEFLLFGATDTVATDEVILLEVNGDTTDANYMRVFHGWDGSALSGGEVNVRRVGALPAASAPANTPGLIATRFFAPDSASWHNLAQGYYADTTSPFANGQVYNTYYHHNSAAKLTRLKAIGLSGGDFIAQTWYAIVGYGR